MTQIILNNRSDAESGNYSMGYRSDDPDDQTLDVLVALNRPMDLTQEDFAVLVSDIHALVQSRLSERVEVFARQDVDWRVDLEEELPIKMAAFNTERNKSALKRVVEHYFSDTPSSFSEVISAMDCFSQLNAFLLDSVHNEEWAGFTVRDSSLGIKSAAFTISMMRDLYNKLTGSGDKEGDSFSQVTFEGSNYTVRTISADFGSGQHTYILGGPKLSTKVHEALSSSFEGERASEAILFDERIYFYVEDSTFYGSEASLIAAICGAEGSSEDAAPLSSPKP